MKRGCLLLLIAMSASAAPTPESAVPSPTWLQGLNADQRAAWFAFDRARAAEADRDELLGRVQELQRKLVVLQQRRGECL